MATTDRERTPAARQRAETALAMLMEHAGNHAGDLVVIGGLNPQLLAGPSAPAHQGTTDVDVLVSLAVVYDRDEQDFSWLEAALDAAGFTPWTEGIGWRWRATVDGAPVKLELICDVYDNQGQEVALPGASIASAINLPGPTAAFRDAVDRTLRMQGRDVHTRFAGLGGYLVAKAAALVSRGEPRDFYDFAYVLLHNPGGAVGAGRAVARVIGDESDLAHRRSVFGAVSYFRDPTSRGARTYAEQRSLDGSDVDVDVLAQDAVSAVLAFEEALLALGRDRGGPMTGALDPALEYHVVNTLQWRDLRPLQRDAVGPIMAGHDCLLLAPTAGGKTEAAFFPTLSRMVKEDWRGLSVLYVTPLRALLNSLHPRLKSYAAWLGRTVGLWHGDVGDSARRRMLADQPDVLLTTPESLEAMLVSRRVDHRAFLGRVRAIVIDELHAFAGDDRGWHLLAVLERIQRLVVAPIQPVGLSATVGNPDQMLAWLQGSARDSGRPRAVVTDATPSAADTHVEVDYVGSVENAAEVISRLHLGEKRLAFCEARRTAEELAFELRERGVTTYVSHSSLSADERRRSERAFAEDRDCVIVATSTLELGVDIGDLDRVIQIDAPRSVASFLQRLGRTGRRAGTVRNTLFLATEPPHLLRALAICLLWRSGFVEAVTPPAAPRHLAAQQLLALALQEGRIGASRWTDWFGDLPVMDGADDVLAHLRSESFLVEDDGVLFVGPAAEREFGARYFMDLLSSFTAAYEMKVVAGRREIGTVSPMAITGLREAEQKRILLAGRGWLVESVDWERREILVSEQPVKAKVRWPSEPIAESFDLVRAQREVLLGATPDVRLSRRAQSRLAILREELTGTVDGMGSVLQEHATGAVWWTWAGWRANETVIAALGAGEATSDNQRIELPRGVGAQQIRAATTDDAVPWVTQQAIDGLKFSAALPPQLARATLAARNADHRGAGVVLSEALVVRTGHPGELPS